MKRILKSGIVALAATLLSSPAFADPVLQIWSCTMNEGKTGDDLVAANSQWLAAAKAVEGGESIEVTIEIAFAANVADGAFNFVLAIDDIATWGQWTSNYANADTAAADEAWSEVATCQNSSLWNSLPVE